MRKIMSEEKKFKFFREKSENIAPVDDDSYYPGRLYVGPFSKKSENLSVGMEIEHADSDSSLGDESVHYYKKGESKLFTQIRSDLPRFFVDPRVQVRMTPNMGKGVFALEDIPKNTLIESAPVILVHKDTFSNLNSFNGGTHKFSEYPFGWGRDGLCAFALGYGGIYNHKVNCNLAWRPNYDYESMQYTTTRDIMAGEEIFIRYVPLYRLSDLWFEDEESEKYAKAYEKAMREDPGTLKTWKLFQPGSKLPKID